MKDRNNRLRLSYSLIASWMRGRREETINTYLHIDNVVTAAMKRGTEFDKYVKEYCQTKRSLPPELGGGALDNPQPGFQTTVQYNELFDLKAEFDVLDSPIIYEIKNSANRDSGDFLEDLQVSFYFLISDLSNIKVDRAWLMRFDPVHRTYDRAMAWKSRRRVNEAREAIEIHGPAILEYFQKEGVI